MSLPQAFESLLSLIIGVATTKFMPWRYFSFSFSTWMSFISFYSLIALTQTANTVLNESAKGEQASLFPILKGKVFSIGCYICCRFVIYDVHYVVICSFYTCFVGRFYHKWMLKFVIYLFCMY